MNRKIVVFAVAAMIISVSVSAQAVSRDSIDVLKHQKEAININKRLTDHKLQLAKLENTLEEKSREARSTANEAQKSADNNGQAANNLSNDSQDKKLAKAASKSAKEAKHDAKEARKASASLDELKKNIETLKREIRKDESKLSSITYNAAEEIPPAIKN